MSLVRFRPEAPYADLAHLVERHLAKVEVAGSSPVIRSKEKDTPCGCLFLWRLFWDWHEVALALHSELATSDKFAARRGANFLITLHFLSKVMQCMTLDLLFCFSFADRGSSPAKHFIEMLRVLSTEFAVRVSLIGCIYGGSKPPPYD